MNCETPGVTLHYTLDGRTPNISDPTCQAGVPVPVWASCTMKVVGVKAGFAWFLFYEAL